MLRRIAGMPDYNAYAEHLRRHHPDIPVLTEREYYTEYLHDRYGDGPTRCC
ncbi:MAG: YbdD/YjiX family protein [Gemmatimonadota bacterium]|nr:YbdD/YjiX family protein [Gemmatimonadota bacterium]